MSSIDQRIVEMRFENHLFEKNANTTINTLERLKSALNFSKTNESLDELEKSANKIDFSSIEKSLSSLEGRFSTFGIAGMTVIEELTKSAMKLGKTLVDNTFGQITSGGWTRATNLDNAKFMIEGLGKTWEEIEPDISFGVQETAYGLDEAAKAAAQLVASGVEFGETWGGEGNSPMAKALLAISGVASMTNSTYSEIAHIFTTTASQGKLLGIQLAMLQNRGLNAAAKLAEALDTTEADVREMVSDGKISFEMFSDAMYDAFGKHAKDSNKTFEGSLANMKASLSRLGAEFAGPFRHNMIDIFNKLHEIFDIIKKQKLNQLYADFSAFAEKVSGFVVGVLNKIDLSWIDTAVSKIHGAYQIIDDLMGNLFPKLWKKTTDASKDTVETTNALLKSAEEVEKVAQRVIAGDYGDGEERRKNLEEEGYLVEQIQNKVNELLGDPTRWNYTSRPELLELEEIKEVVEETVESTEELADQEKNLTRIERIYSNLSKTLKGVSDTLDILKNIASSVVSGALEPLQRIGTALSDVFLQITGTIGQAATNLSNLLKESGAYQTLSNIINTILSKIADGFEWVGDGLNKLLSSESPLKDLFDGIQKGFGTEQVESFTEWLRRATTTVGDFVNIVGTKGIGVAFDLLGKVLGRTIKLLPTIAKATPVITALKTLISGLFTLPGVSFQRTLSKVPKVLQSLANDFNADAILKTAGAIGIVAAALAVLTLVDSSKLLTAVGAIAAIAGVLAILFEVIQTVGGGNNVIVKTITQIRNAFVANWNADTMIKIAAAIGIVAIAFFALAQLDWKKFLVGAGAIVIIAAALGLLINVMGGLAPATSPMKMVVTQLRTMLNQLTMSFMNFLNNTGLAYVLAGLTAFVVGIGIVINKLAGISWANGLKAAVFLGIIFGELVLVLKFIDRFTFGVGMSLFIAALGVFITQVSGALKKLSKIPFFAGLKAVGLLALLLTELVLALYIIKFYSYDKSIGGIKFNGFIKTLAKVIDALADVIVKLSAVPFFAGLKAALLMGLLFTELVIAVHILKMPGNTTLSTMGLLITLGLVADILSKTLKRLSKIDFFAGLKAITFLGLLFAELVVVMAVMSVYTQVPGGNTLGTIATLLSYVLAVSVLVSAIEKLARIEPGRLSRAVATIGRLMLVLTSVMYINSMTANIGPAYKSIVNALSVMLLLGTLVVAILALSEVDPANIEATGKAITAIMAAMAIFEFTSKLPTGNDWASVTMTFIGFGLLLGEIAGLFYLMRDMNPEKMLKISKAMSVIMVSLGALSFGIGMLGGLKQGAGSVLAADILLADIIAIEALAAFVNEKFPGFKKFLHKGLPLLEEIGKGIGTFFGSILSGIVSQVLTGIGTDLEILGTSLNSFVEAIKPFIENAKSLTGEDFDASYITNLGTLMSAIGGLGWESFKAAIASAFADTTGLETPIKNLGKFVDNFTEFNSKLGDITADNVTKLDIINSVMTRIGDIGWESFITNLKSSFASGIAFEDTFSALNTFVEDFATFDGKLKGVSDLEGSSTKLDTIKTVIEKLGDASWATFISGLKTNFFGDVTLTSMGTELVEFGEVMFNYSEAVKGVDDEAVTNSQHCIDVLTALATAIPNTEGGLLGLITGTSDMEAFGKSIVEFGKKVIEYCELFDGKDLSKATEVTQTVKDMNDIFTEIGNSGGLSAPSYIIGDNLYQLGETISQIFSNLAVAVTDEEAQGKLAEGGRKMFGFLMKGFEEAGSEATVAESNSTVIEAMIESMLKGLTGDEAKGLTGDKAKSVITNMVATMAETIVNEDANLSEGFGMAVTDMLQAGTDKVNEDVTDFNTAVKNLIGKVIESIRLREKMFTDRVRTLCELMLGVFNQYPAKFESVGINMMAGLKKGIANGEGEAINAAASAAAKALQAAKKELDSHSPSREFSKLGDDSMEGFALGIIQNERPLTAVRNVAEGVLSTMSDRFENVGSISEEALSEFYRTITATWLYITSMVNQDLVYKPVITPVMDLSSVESGITSANQMMKGFSGMSTPILDYSNRPLEVKTGDLYNQQAIIDAIMAVQRNVETLGTEISKMQVTMNTGQLVGAITNGVDRELGSIQKYNARWA